MIKCTVMTMMMMIAFDFTRFISDVLHPWADGDHVQYPADGMVKMTMMTMAMMMTMAYHDDEDDDGNDDDDDDDDRVQQMVSVAGICRLGKSCKQSQRFV